MPDCPTLQKPVQSTDLAPQCTSDSSETEKTDRYTELKKAIDIIVGMLTNDDFRTLGSLSGQQ